MRKLIVAGALLALVIPAMASANTARTSALASGDARFLPDDSRTTEDFPGRIHEHQRITFENVDPNTSSSSREERGSWGGFTMEHERVNGTIGWFVDRPHAARKHQLYSQPRFDQFGAEKAAHSQVTPASSIVDLFWGNESWGFTGAFGMSSEEFLDDETTDPLDSETKSNMMFDVVLGKNLASGTEVAANFFMSRFGELDGDEQNPNAFGFGANLRHPMELAFFNHLVAGGAFFKDLKFSDSDSVDGRTAFTVDANLLNFTKAGGEAMGGGSDDLTYLLALGVGLTSGKEEGVEDRTTTIQLPKATAGAELDVASWLTVRGSVTHSWNWRSDGDNSLTGGSNGSGVSTTLGAGLHWGRLTMDMVVNNGLLTAGPNFVGGGTPGVANFVTLDWAL
ncbi:MAG: hypothetical protein ACKVU1_10475 [bacterium]